MIEKIKDLRKGKSAKEKHFKTFLLIGIPLAFLYIIFNFFVQRDITRLIIISLFFSAMIAGLFLVGRINRTAWLFRINLFFFNAVLISLFCRGGDQGTMLYWLFLYPLIAYFLMGVEEGSFWNGATFLTALTFLFLSSRSPVIYDYPKEAIMRFVSVYGAITAIALWYEHFRRKVLGEIKTLKGYIPICSSCKKVRDDKGYWNRIEKYIESRSDAEFSHSLCPECLKKLYPDLEDELKG